MLSSQSDEKHTITKLVLKNRKSVLHLVTCTLI